MNKNQQPFKPGTQYEKWEFDLEVCLSDRIAGFDSYYYLGNCMFYNVKPLKTELIFCFDILQIVFLTFDLKNNSQNTFKENSKSQIENFQQNQVNALSKDISAFMYTNITNEHWHFIYGFNEIVAIIKKGGC